MLFTGAMSALISARDLAGLLASPAPPVLLDVQWSLAGPPGREAYAAAHLPGAHFLDLETDLAAPAHRPDDAGRQPGGRHPLPEPQVVQAALRRCGVNDRSAVVVYDQGNGWGSSRAWWVLSWLGLADVRILDGGLPAWRAEGGEVSDDESLSASGTFTTTSGGMPVLDAHSAADLARTGVLLDARAPERYAGDEEPMDPAAGHVPGAVSDPTTANVDPDGLMLPPAALRDRFDRLGISSETTVGAYCGSGVSAAQEVLALHEAGIKAALYVGSWSDWVSDPSRPVATGSAPS